MPPRALAHEAGDLMEEHERHDRLEVRVGRELLQLDDREPPAGHELVGAVEERPVRARGEEREEPPGDSGPEAVGIRILRERPGDVAEADLPAGRRPPERFGDGLSEHPDLLAIEGEARVAARGHLRQDERQEGLMLLGPVARAGIDCPRGVRGDRQVLPAHELREPPVGVSLVEDEDVRAQAELLEDQVGGLKALARPGHPGDQAMRSRVRIERIKPDGLPAAVEEELSGRPGPGEPSVERQEVGEVIGQDPPPAAAPPLERGVVPEGQALEPGGAREEPLPRDPELHLAERAQGRLHGPRDPVGGIERDQVEGGLADACPRGEGGSKELIELLAHLGGLDRLVPPDRGALLPGHGLLEMEVSHHALLVEHRSRDRHQERAREPEAPSRAAGPLREGQHARPRLAREGQDGEDSPFEPVKADAVPPEHDVALDGLGVQRAGGIPPRRRAVGGGVQHLPDEGEEGLAAEGLQGQVQELGLGLDHVGHAPERVGRLMPRPPGRLEPSVRRERPERPLPAPDPRLGGPEPDGQEGGRLSGAVLREKSLGALAERPLARRHDLLDEGVRRLGRQGAPARERPPEPGAREEERLERGAGRQAVQQAFERGGHRRAPLLVRELGVKERQAPRQAQAPVGEDVDPVLFHPPPGEQARERRRIGEDPVELAPGPRLSGVVAVDDACSHRDDPPGWGATGGATRGAGIGTVGTLLPSSRLSPSLG